MAPISPAQAAAREDDIPTRIGPYHIISLLGEGGTGTVYHALHQTTDEAVALKTVRLPHEKYRATLRREIHALSRLEHPGIVRILDHGIWEGVPWYAMENIVGENLRHYARQNLAPLGSLDQQQDAAGEDTSIDLRNVSPEFLDALNDVWDDDDETEINKGAWWTESLGTPHAIEAWAGIDLDAMETPLKPASSPMASLDRTALETLEDLTPEEVRQHFIITLIRRLCEPLAYIHGEGLVHCDLKPENIVIKPDGQPILIDFGLLTRFRDGVGREQIDGRVVRGGTAAYMAPEQFLGERVDARADLYALGCIFYELLVGQAPFVGNDQEIAAQHMFGQPIPPSMRVKNMSDQHDALVMRLLARKPHERTGYAKSVATQVAQWGAAPPDYPETPLRHYLYPSQMHGRQTELTSLKEYAKSVDGGSACCVGLAGRAGVGKTRLAMELVRQLPAKSMRILSATCQERGGMALQAFRPLLVSLADQIQARGPEERQRLLGSHGRILSLYEESLFQVMGGEGSSSFASLPPHEARPILLKSLRSALGALAQEQPLLYIIDDFHRADELTQAALRFFLEEGLPPQIMMLCLWREGEACALGAWLETLPHPNTHTSTLHITPLQEAEIERIIGDMLAIQEVPAPFVESLCELSEGNPFFVSTYMHEAIEEEIFVQDAWGQWHLPADKASLLETGSAPTADFHDARALSPVSLQSLMEKRLDKLDARAAVLAAAAAVLGAQATFGMLQQLVFVDFDERSLLDGLKVLERHGVLEAHESGRWHFVSDPMRELVLSRLLPAQHVTLHRKAAEAMASAASPFEQDATLAHHWYKAGEREKARAAYIQAARQAQARFANEEALQYYQRVLSLSQETHEDDFPVLLAYAELLTHMGQNDEAASMIQQASLKAGALDSAWWGARFQVEAALLSARKGELAIAQGLFEESRAIFEGLKAPIEEARIVGNLGNIALERGEVEAAKRHYQTSLILLRHADQGEGERILRLVQSNMANLLRLQGHLKQSQRLFARALKHHRAAKDGWFEAVTLTSLGCLSWLEGKWDEAHNLLRQALMIHRESGHSRGEGNALGYLSQVLHAQGLFDEAQTHAQSAIQIMQSLQSPRLEGQFRVYLHSYWRRAGIATGDLTDQLNRAQELLEGPGANPTLALAYCERGHLMLLKGQPAEAYLEEAQTLARHLHIELESQAEISQSIARLKRASRSFHNGQPLLFGETPFDHPTRSFPTKTNEAP